MPIHIASMTGLMQHLLENFAGDIEEGDIFISNDPHVAGGTHLPDINMAVPVFHRRTLVGFMCNIAHHADVGGMVPGSMAGGMSEIYQEGLRLPVIKLFRRGKLQQDLLNLILLNVRVPHERRGDYFAQIAACRLGERRLHEIFAAYGAPTMLAAFDEIVERTSRRMKAAVATIPDRHLFLLGCDGRRRHGNARYPDPRSHRRQRADASASISPGPASRSPATSTSR